jgi:hypothetical protein
MLAGEALEKHVEVLWVATGIFQLSDLGASPQAGRSVRLPNPFYYIP